MIQPAIRSIPSNALAFNASPPSDTITAGSGIAHYAAAIVSQLRLAGETNTDSENLAFVIRRETGLDWALIVQALPHVEQEFNKKNNGDTDGHRQSEF